MTGLLNERRCCGCEGNGEKEGGEIEGIDQDSCSKYNLSFRKEHIFGPKFHSN